MIHAESVKAVQELLKERGIEQRDQERWGDYVARGLDLTDPQAEAFLEALDANKTIEEAYVIAGVPPDRRQDNLLVELARSIGRALGSLRAPSKPE